MSATVNKHRSKGGLRRNENGEIMRPCEETRVTPSLAFTRHSPADVETGWNALAAPTAPDVSVTARGTLEKLTLWWSLIYLFIF